MIQIDGVSLSREQYELLLFALQHQVEVDDFFAEDGDDPTDAEKLLLLFQHIGQRQGLEI